MKMSISKVCTMLAISLILVSCKSDKENHGATGDTSSLTSSPASTGDTTGSAAAPQAPAPAIGDSAARVVPPPMTDPNIMAKLDLSHDKELQEGSIGVDKATNGDVRAFAQMLVDHHREMRKEGAQVVSRLGAPPMIAPNDSLPVLMERDLTMLRSTPKGATFDSVFVEHQIATHRTFLGDLNTMMVQAQSPELKSLIMNAIPRVQSHLTRAEELKALVTSR